MSTDVSTDSSEYGPWNPGINSELPPPLLPLSTIFRPENVFTSAEHVAALRDLTGLDFEELVIFRPERILIPSSVGVDFQVTDVKVGKNSQFSASGEVPAVVFAETAFGVRLKMDTCQVSMDITISVRNTNAAQRNFTAAVIGPAVE